jgi:hypothetical protein
MPRYFTLAEAESLLPRVERLMGEAVALKKEFDEAEQGVRAFAERIMMMGGVTMDREKVREMKARRDSAALRLRDALAGFEEIGCVVKDLDIGLVDFPASFRGADVYLCWKLGEARIEFWHGVDEGFAGRKPIGREFRDRRRADPDQ